MIVKVKVELEYDVDVNVCCESHLEDYDVFAALEKHLQKNNQTAESEFWEGMTYAVQHNSKEA